jgi:hypothetical protein
MELAGPGGVARRRSHATGCPQRALPPYDTGAESATPPTRARSARPPASSPRHLQSSASASVIGYRVGLAVTQFAVQPGFLKKGGLMTRRR